LKLYKVYESWRADLHSWLESFDIGIKEKFDEYIFLIQDQENREIHNEERTERNLSFEYGELDIGQVYDEDYDYDDYGDVSDDRHQLFLERQWDEIEQREMEQYQEEQPEDEEDNDFDEDLVERQQMTAEDILASMSDTTTDTEDDEEEYDDALLRERDLYLIRQN
jgi:hypothetical protein